MTPEYIEQLAELADPDQVWRTPVMEIHHLPMEKRHQMDMGVALRRHADHIRRLQKLLAAKRSLLITPLSANGIATLSVPIPPEHRHLRP